MEIAKAKGNTFEGFNTVVAAFSEAIGVRTVKSIEDIGLPVYQHPSAWLEFGQMYPVTGIEPLGEQLRRSGAAFCVHEFKEQFL